MWILGKESSMTSAVRSPVTRDSQSIASRTFGYLRASTILDVESPEAQAEIIATYCRRIGRRLDDIFFDDAPLGGLPLAEREGGKRLLLDLH
jgi:DNA invertase Pin-like site-specific DNA recombinase